MFGRLLWVLGVGVLAVLSPQPRTQALRRTPLGLGEQGVKP